MPTRAETGNGGVQAAVHEVAERARTLVRLEGELAALEVRQKIAALGAGVVLLAAGGVLALFALGFLLATVAAALATALATWLALLLVGAGLALVAALLFAIGVSQLRRGVPPVPEQAIAEAKLTGAALSGRNDG
jgi:Putative Actinobacterial Holin-X, holin superfamily III